MEILRHGDSSELTITPEKWKEFLDYYRTHRDALISEAALARDNGVSHRNFKVGCALISVEPGLKEGEYAVYSAHNFTPTPANRTGWEKRCAERNAVEAAIEKGAFFIPAMVSVSRETSTGDETTKAHDVLHPCLNCREMLRELMKTGVLRDESIICNVNDAEKPEKNTPYVVEEKTLKQLLEMYKDDAIG